VGEEGRHGVEVAGVDQLRIPVDERADRLFVAGHV
jgi:hypothetical protein